MDRIFNMPLATTTSISVNKQKKCQQCQVKHQKAIWITKDHT